jgi:hypothetical protein
MLILRNLHSDWMAPIGPIGAMRGAGANKQEGFALVGQARRAFGAGLEASLRDDSTRFRAQVRVNFASYA